MKTFQLISLCLLAALLSSSVIAQDKTEKIKVWGECGMCKNKIEKAAKEAGASQAVWSPEEKELTVTYNSTSSNSAKIEKAVAAVGYDTKNVKATDEAYSKLHACCKYERAEASSAKAGCCKDSKCAECCKDGKCADCCKDGKCQNGADCCKDGHCEKGMACCKDGKCAHDGKEHGKHGDQACCKKA